MEDNPGGVPPAGSNAAHAVAEINAIVALRPLYWPVMDREGHSITVLKGYHLDAALHARPLFGQDKLAARKVLARIGEENRDLDRECEIAVEVLVQAIEVARNILQ